MKIKVHADGTASLEDLEQHEGQLIWFAMEALKDSYKKSLNDFALNRSGGIMAEDEMFLYEELARVARFQFSLMEDYSPVSLREQVQEWFYV